MSPPLTHEDQRRVFNFPHYTKMKPKYPGYECCHIWSQCLCRADQTVKPLYQAPTHRVSKMTINPVFIASNSKLKTNFFKKNEHLKIHQLDKNEQDYRYHLWGKCLWYVLWAFRLAHVPSANMEGIHARYCSQPPGGDQDVLALLFGELSYGQHITMTSVTNK